MKRHLGHEEVQKCLAELFCAGGVPAHLRSDNGPEFIARALPEGVNQPSVKPLFIEERSAWENGYIESFNGKMRDELPDCEIFCALEAAKILIVQWRGEHHHFRPHSSLGYRPAAPLAWLVSAIRQLGPTLSLVQGIGARQDLFSGTSQAVSTSSGLAIDLSRYPVGFFCQAGNERNEST